MNIICGDALGVTCGTWIAFWNGAMGAFVGAGVALAVVLLTAALQQRHARAAREIEAIAGFVAATGKAYEEVRALDASKPRDLMVTLLSSTVRLRLASPGAALIADAVDRWPTTIDNLAANELTAAERETYTGFDLRLLMSDAYAQALAVVPAWQSGKAEQKKKCLAELRGMSDLLESRNAMAEQAIRDSAGAKDR